jgi:hypothetical protein
VRPAHDARVPTARLDAFDVPPEADEAFLADWAGAGAGAELYRALREDVQPRYVALGGGGADYEVVFADGAAEGGVLAVERFAPGGAGIAPAWHALHRLLAARRGHLGSRLLAGPDVIALTRWSSPLMHHRALHQPEIAAALAALPREHAALYLPV